MGNLLDTAAWIELFKGTQLGLKVKEIIKEERCCTSIVSLAEVISWCSLNNLDLLEYIEIIEKNSLILNLKKNIVIMAGKITTVRKKKIHNWGIMDGFVYATAQYYGMTVVTKDTHFKGLPDVQLLE